MSASQPASQPASQRKTRTESLAQLTLVLGVASLLFKCSSDVQTEGPAHLEQAARFGNTFR